MSYYWERKGNMAILRVRADVKLREENGDIAIQRIRKDVKLLGDKGNVAILRVCRDVMLLWERGHGYTVGTERHNVTGEKWRHIYNGGMLKSQVTIYQG